MTFNHEDALNGDPVWCGEDEITVGWYPKLKIWVSVDGEYAWNMNGSFWRVFEKEILPPLTTTAPEGDKTK